MFESAEERPGGRCVPDLLVKNLLVQLADLPGHLFVAESQPAILLPCPAQFLSTRFIVGQFRDGSGQGLDASWLEKDACLVLDDHFPGTIHVIADDWFASQ